MMPRFPEINKESKTIENVPVKQLTRDFGSPLFVISEKIIKEKYRIFSEALAKYYPNSQIAYSVKTNHLPRVIKVMKDLGAWAEVVSDFEYWLAKKIGFAGEQVIFNGPDKKASDIEMALREGAWIHADNIEEIKIIADASQKTGRQPKIGLRLNSKVGPNPWGRFGFNLENGEAYKTVEFIAKNFPEIAVKSVHSHIGTNINEPKHYISAAEKISDFVLKIGKDFGIVLNYLDLGGGFGVPGSRWLNNPEWIVPEIEEYVESIAEILNKKFTDKRPGLFFEPGRYLIDEAAIFLVTVVNSKKIEQGQLANLDTSAYTQIQAVAFRKNIIDVIKNSGPAEPDVSTWLGGNSCIGPDFLAQSISLPRLSAGDILVFYNAGAYTMVRNEQWIHPRPAVVMIKEDGGIECIRNKESYENMISLDNF